MIITAHISCKTCGQKYFLRVGLGLESYQSHSFDCTACTLPITIAVRNTDDNDARFEGVENAIFIEDIRPSLVPEKDGFIVVNLHPLFAFSQDEIHSRTTFVSLEYSRKILKYLRFNRYSKLQDTERQFNVPNANNLWTDVKNILLLKKRNGSQKAIIKIISNYEKKRKKICPNT